MDVEIIRRRDRLDHLFSRVETFTGDIELQSHWARYLCILVAGFIETSIRGILSEYSRSKATPQVANYAEHQLRFFQNPNI